MLDAIRHTITLPTPERPVVLVEGDCIERMRELEPASVQVVLTDPPAGIGFMGKPWDSFAGYAARTSRGQEVAPLLASMGLAPWASGFVVFMVDVWSEASRVLVPGGWVCAWALPKTSDLAGLALRLAGLEVVDMGLHLFGSGMPKGCNIGKQIDKEAGAVREVVGERVYAGGHVQRSAEPTDYGFAGGNPELDKRLDTAPATPEAKAWDGWNTQLAPGFELWHLARKPRERGLSLASNAVKHGAGALNIDACRVPREAGNKARASASGCWASPDTYGDAPRVLYSMASLGSYPPNVLLTHALDCEPGRCVDGCPCKALDEQSGNTCGARPSAVVRSGADDSRVTYGDGGYRKACDGSRMHDAGGASRFFPQLRYQAKAKRRDIPGRATTLSHPTHKHPDLIRWLVRLLAAKHWGPAGPLVLDTFAGSGTTLVACLAEGVRCIGFELDPINAAEARARLGAAMGDPGSAREDNEARDAGQLAMF